MVAAEIEYLEEFLGRLQKAVDTLDYGGVMFKCSTCPPLT